MFDLILLIALISIAFSQFLPARQPKTGGTRKHRQMEQSPPESDRKPRRRTLVQRRRQPHSPDRRQTGTAPLPHASGSCNYGAAC